MINPYKKVLDSVTYKGEARPILQCVHYEKGNAYATDSHQLVKFSGIISDDTLEQNINLLTDLPDFGNYPDVTRLFSDDFASKISFENYDSTNKSFKELVKFLKSAKNQNITLKISDKMCILSTGQTGFNLKDIKIYDFLNDFSIVFNAKYLFNALNQIPNFSKKENYKGDVDIEFKDDPLYPFQVHFDKMTFVVAPTRTYKEEI